MASYIQGYDEDRFVTKINRSFFCLICFNVLRDPVLCPRNQHCFCRSCITKQLETAERCPTCADHLTVETLVEPTRMVKDYLNESNISSVYIERGCQEILQFERLDEHEGTCGFTPVVCTNEGCGVTVSKRDLAHHKSEVCEFRKSNCHSCQGIAKALSEIELRMTKLEASMKEIGENREKNKAELQADMANLNTNLEGRFEAVNKEVEGLKAALFERFDEMKDVLVKFDPDRKREIIREGRPRPSSDRENILVAGGDNSNSVEMFDWRQQLWFPMQSLPEKKHGASSFVYNNHVTITGGIGPHQVGFHNIGQNLDTMIGMNVEAKPDFTTHWSEYPVELSAKLAFHSSMVYNDQLIVTGGSGERYTTSVCIYEIQLSHPFFSKILSRMPEARQKHGSAMFDDNLLIVGGGRSGRAKDSVLLYDVKENEYEQLAPLPHKVYNFATVKYGDDIVLIGGCDERDQSLNTIVMYNVVTQQNHMLPPMKYKRSASAAVVVGKNVVVMGGACGPNSSGMNLVEVFSFDNYTWNYLPAMSEPRKSHTAVVV